MTEGMLLQATGVFSAAVGLVLLLRRPVGRVAGAQAQYLLWLLVPAVLVAAGLAALQPQRSVRWQIDLPEGDWTLPAPGARVEAPASQGEQAPPFPMALGVWALGSLACGVIWGWSQTQLLARRRLPAGSSAALVGAWRPRLRLPADFRARFPAAERRLILLHERLHAERGDTRWLLLALTLVALQWFNPLAWWALRRLRSDMELACDAAVLQRRPEQLGAYRRALLRAEGLPLPLTATPCASHPLIERLQMLPAHRIHPPRRGLAALLIAGAAGLAYAAEPVGRMPTVPAAPSAPTAPMPPSAQSLPKAPAAVAPAAAAVQVAEPPAPVRAPEPPAAAGYSKLRLDYQVSVNGQVLATDLLLQTFNERWPQRLALPGGSELMLLVEGRPHRDERLPGQEDLLLLQLALFDGDKLIGRPRLITKDGVAARIEIGDEGLRVLRIDLLPRIVSTRLHDARGALAELKRDIEAGRAPAVGVAR